MKKLIVILLSLLMVLSIVGCGSKDKSDTDSNIKKYKVGICNYVDDASLNQIYENIEATLKAAEEENNIVIEILYDNGNADSNVLNQIISNFITNEVDVMVGIATPVALMMQAATEDNQIPVIFSAVSDPIGCDLVESLDIPGANISGTSDYLNTNALMDLIFAYNPDIETVGLLYDLSQDSSTKVISDAKAYLDAKGVNYIDKTGNNPSDVILAAQSLVSANVDVIFTPTDNTIMKSELSIYELFADAGIAQFAGADSFALNGAFVGYGVDYANLGVETAKMVLDVLLNNADPSTMSVKTFDNGIATVNTEICEKLGVKFEDILIKFAPYCTEINQIETAENF